MQEAWLTDCLIDQQSYKRFLKMPNTLLGTNSLKDIFNSYLNCTKLVLKLVLVGSEMAVTVGSVYVVHCSTSVRGYLKCSCLSFEHCIHIV